MRTIQFRFEPDQSVPMFSRLKWEIIDVPLRDVLESGVHPWSGNNLHPDLPDALCEKLNQSEYKPEGLQPHRMLWELTVNPVNTMGNQTRTEQFLTRIQKEVLFCEPDLGFPVLANIARATLAERWNRSMALRLAERLNPSFSELRRFLKAKDNSVKLKGQSDLDDYNWGHILSLEDFANHERLLIEEAFGPVNFRTRTFLSAITDRQSRLQLKSRIDNLTLTQPSIRANQVPLLWHGERQGSQWRVRPNVGASMDARATASEFAERWRRDRGKLCFATRTEDLLAMAESGAAQVSFPNLRYARLADPLKVLGEIPISRVALYSLGSIPTMKANAEKLKSILREYGASTSGLKKVLLERVADVAVQEYTQHEERLDGFFEENRFVRVASTTPVGRPIPVFEQEKNLRGLLLCIYFMRHLRGNVVVDVNHVNDSCSVKELALALLERRVTLTGGFLQVR